MDFAFRTPGLADIDSARSWGDLRRAAQKQAERSEKQGTTSANMADPPAAGQTKTHVRVLLGPDSRLPKAARSQRVMRGLPAFLSFLLRYRQTFKCTDVWLVGNQ